MFIVRRIKLLVSGSEAAPLLAPTPPPKPTTQELISSNTRDKQRFEEELQIIQPKANYFSKLLKAILFAFWLTLLAGCLIGLSTARPMADGTLDWEYPLSCMVLGVMLFASLIVIFIYAQVKYFGKVSI
jgi:hypothetical protein